MGGGGDAEAGSAGSDAGVEASGSTDGETVG
jgi:hypothetical protein